MDQNDKQIIIALSLGLATMLLTVLTCTGCAVLIINAIAKAFQ